MQTLKVILLTSLAGAVLLVVGALAFIYSGIYNVAADIPHSRFEYWILFTTRDVSITRRARNIEMPAGFTDEQRVERGAFGYETMCAACHLEPSAIDTPLHRGLLPEAPDLTRWSDDPAKAFWIVKHGIRMTGMPAWGRTHDDETLWDVVAFLQRLPGLSAEEYAALVRAGERSQRTDDHAQE